MTGDEFSAAGVRVTTDAAGVPLPVFKAVDPAAEAERLGRERLRVDPGLDGKAAAFAKAHGSFSLWFDAGQNYVRPDDTPWSLILDSDEGKGWGGFTAEQALDFAAAELAKGSDGH